MNNYIIYGSRTFSVKICLFFALMVSAPVTQGNANDWATVTGVDTLKDFMSGLTAERTLPNGEISRGEYRADGTGTLYSWGAEIDRAWTIEGDDTICIEVQQERSCYSLEQSGKDASLYRVQELGSGEFSEISIVKEKAITEEASGKVDEKGGAATPSSAELAAELSNPNTAVASLTFKNQFRWFEGDLPDADDQFTYTLLFQPALPFVLDSGDKIIWRPAVPLVIDQPVFAADGSFDGESGLGDIAFDLAFAPKNESGLIFAYGLITSLPTATEDSLGSDKWTLGPELLIGKATPKHVYGIFPNHQWDLAGSGDNEINLTSIQAFYTHLPGGGWSVGSGPTMTYDWESEQWTVPLQINGGKTVVWNGRPWKLSVELNYYVEKADSFGPEWMLSFNIAPVVKNGMASWFGL